MPLDALLRPRSIAILGASERPSIGRSLIVSARNIGFAGNIYPINPRYPELLGHPCYPSVEALPEAPDVVAFCVSYTRILENFRPVAAKGAKAAAIFDGGFAERGDEGAKLQAEIVGICREAGILLNGPNCMGVLNPATRSSIYIHEVRDATGLAGNVGLISQSGSVCIGLVSDVRRFGFSHIISSGNEALIGAAEYMEALIDDPATKVIALFTETIKEPERFVAALDRAADLGKPVVVLKVGRTERTKRAITTHTGGLAGDARVFSEVLKAHRAIAVDDMDELTEVLAVCQGERWPRGRRLSVITASGGQAELMLDIAAERGLDVPPLPAEQRSEAERVIGAITGDGNPLDAWGNGDYATNFPHAFKVLDRTPSADVIVFCGDSCDGQPMGRTERPLAYTKIVLEAAQASSKPHYVMNTRPGLMLREQMDLLRKHGIAMIGGSRQGLGAIDKLARYHASSPDRALRLICAGRRGKRSTNSMRSGCSRSMASRSRRRRSWPPRARRPRRRAPSAFPWCSRRSRTTFRTSRNTGSFSSICATKPRWRRLGVCCTSGSPKFPAPKLAGILVQQMIAGGVEVFAGVSRDPDFGHALAFGIGRRDRDHA
jgi:acetate---CoA ligase (ADP-forming)